jgi:hypothetical protein
MDPRSMRVAGNDHVNSANCWINLQFLKVVQDIERSLSELYCLSVRIMFRPVGGIDVPSNRSDRRNPTESDKNIRTTNIASVDDMCHPGKLLLGLWPQEPVRVRDDSNPQYCNIHRCVPNGMPD